MKSARHNTLIVLTLCAALSASSARTLAQQVENYIILRVNNRIATLVDYQLRRDDRLRALAASNVPPDQREVYLDNLGESIMGDLVEEMLLLSRADQLGITAPRGAVEQELAAARQRAGATTEGEFDLALARAGMTREDLEQQIDTNVTMRQVINREIMAGIEITEEDLRRTYFENAERFTEPEKRRVREFVLAEDEAPIEELRRAAEGVRGAIAAGADPEEAVQAEPLAGNWIDIGLVAREDLDPDLAEQAWQLEAGDISEPIQARGGLHVLQVMEVVPAQLMDFDQVRNQIAAAEQQRLFAENYQEYMEDLRRDSYVQINDLPEDARDFDLEASAQRMTLTDLADPDVYGGEADDEGAEPPLSAEPVPSQGDESPPTEDSLEPPPTR